ncbi:RHS repeat-associated core domain-containing protein [Streptomyces sp. JJ66]|uniref:RHS repeat-associated core domain-containing protein n=1 Tax=Streptomyces sp. JJ66 TaxID=2803843 RepID=UPI0035B0EF82
MEPASGKAGAALGLQKCDGSANQQIRRTTTGQLKHRSSGLCLAVRNSSTANSTPVVLTGCGSAATAQRWEPQNETRHIYGPDGSRLLTVQQQQATLHLGEAEVTVRKGGDVVSTQRTYAASGGTVLRSLYGTGSERVVALASDHQGSPYAEVHLTGDMAVRVRKQDPFGNQRGTDTVGAGLTTHTGFLGATEDNASGYTPLGARLYDPAVGRFLSADPLLDLADPLQSNGYAYAHNNPVTLSDPTGLAVSLTASERAAALAGAGLSAAAVAQATADKNRSIVSVIRGAAWGTLKEFIGINDAVNCFQGDLWGCGSLIIGAIPLGKVTKIPSALKAIGRTVDAILAWRTAVAAAKKTLAVANAALAKALKSKKAAIAKAKKAAQAAKKKAAEKAQTTSNKAVNTTKKTGNTVQKKAQAKSNPRASSVAKTHGTKRASSGTKSTSKPGGSSGASSRSKGGTSGSGGSGKVDEAPESGGTCNSFTPDTKVLMADGSTKPIKDVKTGDKVIATDPRTGETRVETVTAEITGQGLKHLVKVTIDTDGDQGTKTAQVTSTDGHPFWVPELDAWIGATDLQPGQWLRTSAGTHVQITAVKRWTTQQAGVHNLTVSNLHTYYVVAGSTPVLSHNTGGGGHMCDITATAPDGSTRVDVTLESGDMTPEEAALGYPNNVAFTHTEHRFSRMAGASTGPKVSLPNDPSAGKHPLSPGDAVTMRGQLPPCPRCKGAMNRMVRELGVSVTYIWDGVKGAGTWRARGKR